MEAEVWGNAKAMLKISLRKLNSISKVRVEKWQCQNILTNQLERKSKRGNSIKIQSIFKGKRQKFIQIKYLLGSESINIWKYFSSKTNCR